MLDNAFIIMNGAEIDTYESWGSMSRSIVFNDAGQRGLATTKAKGNLHCFVAFNWYVCLQEWPDSVQRSNADRKMGSVAWQYKV